MRDRVTTRESARPWAQGAGGALSCLAASLLLLVGSHLLTDVARHRCSLFSGPGVRGDEAALYIGMDVLRHLHIYYAAKEQVLYFSDPEAGQ